MMYMNQMGQKIAQRRREMKMSQQELASLLNISYQAVSNWERGLSSPDIMKLPELSSILDISIDCLLGTDREENNPRRISAYSENQDADDTDAINNFVPNEIIRAYKLIEGRDVNEIDFANPEDYMNYDALFRLGCSLVEQEEIEQVYAVLQYFPRVVARRVVVKIYKKYGISALEKIVPFLEPGFVTVLACMEIKKGNIKDTSLIIPYINKIGLRNCLRNLKIDDIMS